uniref:Uncharacterized protein n=1 Tax=Arundo donax TaxID=35708 RepID=A0A0A9BI75_ARUDO
MHIWLSFKMLFVGCNEMMCSKCRLRFVHAYSGQSAHYSIDAGAYR